MYISLSFRFANLNFCLDDPAVDGKAMDFINANPKNPQILDNLRETAKMRRTIIRRVSKETLEDPACNLTDFIQAVSDEMPTLFAVTNAVRVLKIQI